MATCPHCGTENKDNAIFCIHCRKPLPKRSRKPGGTQPLAERVPAWLTQLLAKHKEYPAPLIGLEPDESAEMARLPRVAREPEEGEGELSNLLAQLAEEGAPPPAGDRLTSSVEWGAYGEAAGSEPSAPSIDDFLADLEVSPTESYARYEPPPVEPARSGADVPDWLSEGLTPPPPQPRPASPPEPALPHTAVPDWLTESSADFTSPESTVGLEPDLPLDEHHVPDWLNEAVKLPSTKQPELSPETEAELPDWLDDLPSDQADTGLIEETETGFEAAIPDWISAIVPSAPDAPESEPEAEAEDAAAEPSDWNIPDWITAAQMTEEEEAELAALTPATDQTGPDWLELEESVSAKSPELSDWLSAGTPPSTEPKPDAPPADEADTTAPPLKPPDTAWLVGDNLPSLPPAPPVEPTDAEETAKPHRPLRRLKPLSQRSPEQPVELTQPGSPDWVTGLLPADFAGEPAGTEPQSLPDWAVDLTPPAAASAAAAVTPPPDWAKQLVPPGFEDSELEAPPHQPLRKIAAKPDSGPVAPKPATDVPVLPEDEFPADEAEATDELDWIAQFSHALPGTREFDAATAELSPEPPAESGELVDERLDWLVSEGEREAESPAEPAEAAPDWLAELAAPASAAEAGEDSEMPDWLAELPAPDSEEGISSLPPTEAAIDRPDWLSELSAAPAAAEPETTDWLFEPSDSPEAEQAEVDIGEEELEIPAWLAQSVQSMPDTVPTTTEDELELETPEWLAEATEPAPSPLAGESLARADDEIPSTEEIETPPWLEEAVESAGAVEAEADMPDWLAELEQPPAEATEPAPSPLAAELLARADDEIPATEEIETPPWLEEVVESTGAVEAEADMPDWLAELHAPPAETESRSEPAAEAEELPDWLTELPEAPTPEVTAPALPAAEPELDVPPWMSELEAAAPAEAEAEETPARLAESPAATAEPEAMLPEWLAALRPAPAEAEEIELPDWLSELEAAPVETDQIAPPDQPVGSTTVPFEMIDAEPATEPDLPESAETELPDLEEEQLPDWLAEGPAAPAETDEADLPEWLAGVTETVVADQPPAEAEDEPEEAEADWIGAAGLAASLAVGAAMVATEAEDGAEPEPSTEGMEPAEELVEWPDWLSELRESPPAEPFEQQQTTEEIEELPDWLAELPGTAADEEPAEAPETETATPSTVADLLESPAWLADLTPVEAETETAVPDWLAEPPETAVAEVQLSEEAPEPPAEPVMEAEPPAETEIELPPWLAELPAEPAEAETTESEEPADATIARSSWLTRLSAPLTDAAADETPAEELPVAAEKAEAESGVPDWLAELGEDAASEEELVIPDWLTGVAAADTIVSSRWRESEPPVQSAGEAEQIEAEAELEALEEAPTSTEPAIPADQPIDLAGEPQLLDWLSDSEATAVLPPVAEETSAPELAESAEVDVVEPAAPLAVEPVETGVVAAPAPAERPKPSPDQAKASTSKPKSAKKKSVPGGVDSSVAEADDESLKVAEATGVLGLSSLLPAQEVMAGATISALGPKTVGGQKDAVLEAAREFQAIATRVPQPASLPAPLTRRDTLLQGGARAGLYLLFMILIAIPLLPGLQKLTSSGQPAAWTEPTGSLAEVLDRQRRELISNELGVVDFQQPGSVALVSFDYSPATQGEMQPLADAVIGRLRGQGMRLIFISLEPEGAAVAQQTLERLLAERNEAYGTNLVNLGYLPGQVVAVRALASGRPLSTLVDPNTDQPFGQGETATWNDVEDLAQVDMVVTLADNPATSRWWIEQLATAVEPVRGERFILAATSATAQPYLQPYRSSNQLDGLVSGINGAAAIEASRKNFGPARQMLDSQSIAHLLIIILIAAGTMVGWMPPPEQHST